MLEFQITNLDELPDLLEELEAALAQLNGKLCNVCIDPTKPGQVQAAIQTVEEAVEEKLSEFLDNPLVQQVAAGIKQKLKKEILKRAGAARRQLALNAIPFDPLHTSGTFGGTVPTPLKRGSSLRPAGRRKF